MKIGSFFLSLGVKDDGALKTMNQANSGLMSLKQNGLAAKAAFVGAIYGVTRMIGGTAATGMELQNLSLILDVTTKRLQQYAYAGELAGTSAEDTYSALKQLGTLREQVMAGGKLPEWVQWLQQRTGTAFSEEDAGSPEKMVQKIQEAVQRMTPSMRSMFSGISGLSESFIAAMAKGGFNEKTMAQAPLMNVDAAANMDKNLRAFEKRLEGVRNKWVMTFGPAALQAIDNLVMGVDKLATKIKTGLDDALGKKGSKALTDSAIGTGIGAGVLALIPGIGPALAMLLIAGKSGYDFTKFRAGQGDKWASAKNMNELWEAIKPVMNTQAIQNPATTYGAPGGVVVQQNFYGPASPQDVKDAARKGVETGNRYRTSPAQKREN